LKDWWVGLFFEEAPLRSNVSRSMFRISVFAEFFFVCFAPLWEQILQAKGE
jgi:hypothetical protein